MCVHAEEGLLRNNVHKNKILHRSYIKIRNKTKIGALLQEIFSL